MALPPQRLCCSVHSPFIAFFKSCIWFADTHLQNENNELSFPEIELDPWPVLEKREDCCHLRSPLSSDTCCSGPAASELHHPGLLLNPPDSERCQLKLGSVWQSQLGFVVYKCPFLWVTV